MSQSYHFPAGLSVRVLLDLALGRSRSILDDAAPLLATGPAPRLLGLEQIPAEAPLLVLFNHYHRPGVMSAWWPAIGLAAAIQRRRPAVPLHFISTDAWIYPDRLRSYTITPATRLFLSRLSRTYGFVTTPPVVDWRSTPGEGTSSVRRFLALAKQVVPQGATLAMAPEGRDGLAGELVTPPPGAGRLVWMLHQTGFPLLPAGIGDEDGRLVIRFGPVFTLQPPAGLKRQDLDHWVADRVMAAIAAQLPVPGRP